jgi:MFS family permease
VASLLCGLAPTQGVLVVARALQGIGGAVVSAVSLSLIMSLFPEGPQRVRAMGYFGSSWRAAAASACCWAG